MAEKEKYLGTGKRKSSVARVSMMSSGKGVININGIDISKYIPRESLITVIKQPLVAVEQDSDFDISINVSGGGLSGQAGAIRLVIRACFKVDAIGSCPMSPSKFTGLYF